MHCASHNLNLMLKDAIEAVTENRQLYDTVESVYHFSDIVLCGGKSFRISMIVLAQILHYHLILTSTKPKERDEAMAIKKQTENFDFVCKLVVQCKILQIVNIPSKAMQCKTIDSISAINFCKLLLKTLFNSEGVLTQY